MSNVLIYKDDCTNGFCASQIACAHGDPYDRIYPHRDGQSPPQIVSDGKPLKSPYLEPGDEVMVLGTLFPPEVMEGWTSLGIRFVAGAHRCGVGDQYERRCAENSGWRSQRISMYDKGVRYEIETDGNAPSAVYLSERRGAAGIAWAYFCPMSPEPWIVRYVEDRFLGKDELPNTTEVNSYIDILPAADPDHGWFKCLAEEDVPSLISKIIPEAFRV